jgi:hypothetical protein
MDKQILYGIFGCCIGIVVGFAVFFPIWYQLPLEKRGYIGVPMMLIIVIGLCTLGGILGVKKAGPEFPDDDE